MKQYETLRSRFAGWTQCREEFLQAAYPHSPTIHTEVDNLKTRSQRRHTDYAKAIRKRDISKHNYGFDYYDNLHEYSKNKIHCSCPLCRAKTNNKTHKHVWFPAMNWSMMDRRRLDEMQDSLNEYEGGDSFVA